MKGCTNCGRLVPYKDNRPQCTKCNSTLCEQCWKRNIECNSCKKQAMNEQFISNIFQVATSISILQRDTLLLFVEKDPENQQVLITSLQADTHEIHRMFCKFK